MALEVRRAWEREGPCSKRKRWGRPIASLPNTHTEPGVRCSWRPDVAPAPPPLADASQVVNPLWRLVPGTPEAALRRILRPPRLDVPRLCAGESEQGFLHWSGGSLQHYYYSYYEAATAWLAERIQVWSSSSSAAEKRAPSTASQFHSFRIFPLDNAIHLHFLAKTCPITRPRVPVSEHACWFADYRSRLGSTRFIKFREMCSSNGLRYFFISQAPVCVYLSSLSESYRVHFWTRQKIVTVFHFFCRLHRYCRAYYDSLLWYFPEYFRYL